MISEYTITDDALIFANSQEGIDLSSIYKFTLSLYQDYDWIIRANQSIDRYFTVSGQVGSSVIDVPAKRVVAYVPKTMNRRYVDVTSLKLVPADVSTMTPNLTV